MRESDLDARDAVFIISVAARLVEMHPSTLRKYEKCGLLEPCRMSGRLRLYSPEDIARLRQIKGLVEDRGINLAGVELAFALTECVQELRRLCDAEVDGNRLRAEARRLASQMLLQLGIGDPDSGADVAADEARDRDFPNKDMNETAIGRARGIDGGGGCGRETPRGVPTSHKDEQ